MGTVMWVYGWVEGWGRVGLLEGVKEKRPTAPTA